MMTPWGKADQVDKTVVDGIYWVGTPSHGGYMIGRDYAKKLLSPAAIERGQGYGNYLCYEEDCLYAIVMWEIPELRSAGVSEDQLLGTLSSYYPDYLLAKGVKPKLREQFQCLSYKLKDQLRNAKNPILVVAALSIGEHAVKVWTADDKQYIVTKSSYHDANTGPLTFMNQLEVIREAEEGE